jgi:outer membrane protein assembly factor BamA
MVPLALLLALLAPLRIGTITIESDDVYSETEAKRGSLFKLADKLHVETRPSLVRRFLLFKEGDVFVPERLAETERNLRALGFLKSVSVTAGPPHDGVVDVAVKTQDAWSIDVGTDAGSRGGVGTWGFSLADHNLAGFGRQLSLGYNRGVDRSRAAIDYRDPQFFLPYMQARLTFAQNSDGFEHRLRIGRPFYAFSSRWSAQVSFDEIRRNDRLYESGLLTNTFMQQNRQIVAAAGFALHPNDENARRLTAGVRFIDDRFAGLHSDDRTFRYLFVGFDAIDNDYVKLNYIDHDMRDEDFSLGHRFSTELGVSPRSFGAPATTEFFRISEGFGRRLGENAFILPSVSFESRIDHGLRNAILSANVRYVRRFDTTLPQAFVARAVLNNGWNLDPEVQFFADGGDGLRGFRLHSFSGSRNLIVNAEQRVFLGREVAQLLSPGLAFFADAGTATNGSLLRRLNADIGIGLRMGLPRTHRSLLRLDLAYALNRDPLGRRGFLISFSSGQAF